MSQNDFTIANQGFPAFRADLNSALQALATNNSGATAPSTTFANMWWYDTATDIMYIRNEDNDAWIKFAELDQTNDKFILSGTLQLDDGTVSAPALTFNSDTNMGLYRGGTDILKFVTAGVDRVTIDASGKVGLGIDPSTLPIFVSHAVKIANGGGLSITSPSSGDNRYIFFGTGTSSADVQLAGIKNTGSDITFLGVSGAERFKIHDNGVVAPLNGIALGVGTANTASNVLDDYEEGIWEPSIGGDATYTSQDGVYTKIGNMVHLQCKFQVNVIGTGSTNVLSGLPFASNNSWTSGSLSVEYYASIATSMVWVSGYVANNASNISFSGNSASATTIGHNGFAIFGNSARVDFQCSYRTA